jgi:N-acetylglutamate synthase-like GNAT family acetyltransferase
MPSVLPTFSPATQVRIHKARIQDALEVYDLVNSLSGDGTLLRRNYAEICENIRDFTVAHAVDPNGATEFLGCGALHLYGPHLAEVRSIVMKPEAKGIGAGGELLQALVHEAEEHAVMSVCFYAHPYVLRALWFPCRGTFCHAGQDLQGLSDLPSALCLR